uniref:Cytochrome P450 n=1 Tax=Panagrolaimus sp. PS1159 TaxID=55785 RepID=A0AC35FNP7_9BILA
MKNSALGLIAVISGAFVLRSAIKFIIQSWFLYKAPLYFTAFLLLFIYVSYELYFKRRRLPSGPTPFLIAGNMLSVLLNPNLDQLFLKWKQKFGGIYTFWMGPVPMVFVSDIEIMKRYFVKNAESFSHRWRNFITDSMLG